MNIEAFCFVAGMTLTITGVLYLFGINDVGRFVAWITIDIGVALMLSVIMAK